MSVAIRTLTDHDELLGLTDDDHAQYLLATGARTGASSQAQAFTLGVTIPASAGLNTISIQRLHAVYCVGDSITDTTETVWLNTLLGASWIVRDLGVPGNRASQMLARFTAEVINPADAEYVVILGGINDVSAGESAAAIQGSLQSMYTAAHNAGMKVVALTITPFKGVAWWTSGKQTIVDTVNTWIATSANYVDYVIDTFAVMEDPATPDTLLPAYDSGDHLHPSSAGSQAIADAIYAGTTWTASTALATLAVSGTPSFNQSLLSTDSPSFIAMTLRDGLVAKSLIINEVGQDNDVRIEGSDDENLFFTDASTNRVGINTATPFAKLEIVGGNLLLGNTYKAQWWNSTGSISTIIEVDSGDNVWLRAALAAGSVYLGAPGATWVRVQSTDLLINDVGADFNVRIEGDTEESLFFTDGGTDRVGIGTSAPATRLHVIGDYIRLNAGLKVATDGSNNTEVSGVNHLYFYPGTAIGSAAAGMPLVTMFNHTVPKLGIGTTAPAAKLHIDQLSTTGAVPVLTLDQADVSEEFIRFIGSSTYNASQSLVDAANMTTPGAIVGWLKIYVQDDETTGPITDGVYFVPFYAAPTA